MENPRRTAGLLWLLVLLWVVALVGSLLSGGTSSALSFAVLAVLCAAGAVFFGARTHR
ncbi:hypothetical protein [Kocuria rosea]|uniref:hypothetical protein n=1 Tax=Kocuria rosea TaxID=1275 RepID=UPI00203E4F37|nr:hypothetical protein [Kocuria rosea]